MTSPPLEIAAFLVDPQNRWAGFSENLPALDGARASGVVGTGTLKAFERLDELLVALSASVGRS